MKERSSRLGFSLVESTLAVLIAGIAACLLVPALLRHLGYCRLDNAAHILQAAMIKARYLAVSHNCHCRLVFNTATHSYLIQEDLDDNGYIDGADQVHPPQSLPEQVRFNADGVLGPPSDPTRPPSDPVTFTRHTMIVGPNGLWSSPGSVYLGNPEGDHLALTVAMGGRIRIWLWDPQKCRWQ